MTQINADLTSLHSVQVKLHFHSLTYYILFIMYYKAIQYF